MWCLVILKTIGQVGLTLLTAILSGKTVKRLLIKPLLALSKKTVTKEDDEIVKNIEEDWGIPEPKEGDDTHAS